MKRTIEDKAEEARQFFVGCAEAEKDEPRRKHFEYCADMAEAVRDTLRYVDHVKVQLEEIQHALGRHVQVSGTVPHTARGRR